MRHVFMRVLTDLAAQDESIHLMVGDLGYSVIEKFKSSNPDRFRNCAIAEQSMLGIAAGMSMASGATVFVYSIANFCTLRAFEQIRNDVCYHGANVKIVGVGGGLSYGTQGYTHFAVEEVAAMRLLPGMHVACPSDCGETEAVTKLAARRPGPWYIQLFNKEDVVFPGECASSIEAGMPRTLLDGDAGTIFTCGGIAQEVYQAALARREDGEFWRVCTTPIVSPIASNAIVEKVIHGRPVIVVEEQRPVGGLSSVVLSALHDGAHSTQMSSFHSLTLPDMLDYAASTASMRDHYGLSAKKIENRLTKISKNRSKNSIPVRRAS